MSAIVSYFHRYQVIRRVFSLKKCKANSHAIRSNAIKLATYIRNIDYYTDGQALKTRYENIRLCAVFITYFIQSAQITRYRQS